MRLGDFIISNMEPILAEWEEFATTIVPAALTMDSKALRDHAKLMLEEIALDLRQTQTDEQQMQKSRGQGRLLSGESSAEVHAEGRLYSGFTIEQLVSEYRALRASVLKMWEARTREGWDTDAADMMRFNEAVDQAIAESVSRYAQMVSRSQHLFLAILGHDLRNPLSTTVMASRFIMEGNNVAVEHAKAATRIHNAGQRMNKLVNDLIDYSRTNLGSGMPITLKDVDLEAMCSDAIAEQQHAHPQYTFELLIDANCKVRWDDNRIAQVLSNLLGNAVQYGERTASVVLRVTTGDDMVVLRVENRGEVIPPEKLHAVFEPMVRLAAEGQASPANNSLGIGLFVAREIVQAHGGSITVTSDAARGTVFSVTLPRQAKKDVEQHWTAPVSATGRSQSV